MAKSMDHWPEVKIGDLGEVFTGRTPPTHKKSYYGSEYPFITPGDMRQGKYALHAERGLSQEGADLLKRIQLPANAVCVSCIGWQMGETILTARPSFTNQQINTIVPSVDVDSSFLYYSLRTRKQEFLSLGASTGVRTPILNKSAFCNLTLLLPPLPTQRRIAGILSAYDELIANNQRRIAVLEQMARALYREWFVYFRFPAEASAKVGAPGVRIQPGSELPEGWELGILEDVVTLQRGFDLPKAQRVDGTVPIIAATGITGWHNEARVKAPGVVTGRSGTIGEVLYIQEDYWPLNTSLWSKAFPKSVPLFAYYTLSGIELKQFNAGAAVPSLNRNDIHGLPMPIPPMSLQIKFQEIAGAMHEQMKVLEESTNILRRTRDLLLPRLMSGRVEVNKIAS
ncbi:MAG: restriction endonuclease subunit S [Flavobacteriales bacterium]|nr:restriction endonuclease subunit S [Flavobacteriales bacterium]